MVIVVLGAGHIGYEIAKHLSRESREIVLVESNAERISAIEAEGCDFQIVAGNAADPDVLIQAGVQRAALVVAVTNSDEVNICACLWVSRLAPEARRVARIRSVDTRRHGPLLSGEAPVIHSIINPEEISARHIADLVAWPGATELHWLFERRVACVRIPITAESPMAGRSLLDVGRERDRANVGFLIVFLIRADQAFVPGARDTLQPGDHLYVVSLEQGLEATMNLFCVPAQRRNFQHLTIFGGGAMGLYLAELLEAAGKRVKLIERDAKRASTIADQLNGTLVLCGEPLDPDIFVEERIFASDAFIAVSSDQEDNLIAALYAKSRGVRAAFAVLTRPQAVRLGLQIGIDAAFLPQQVAIGKILEHLHTIDVNTVIVVNQNDVEIIEVRVPAHSHLASRPLSQIRFPEGTLLLAVERFDGATCIPDGNTVVEPGARIALIGRKQHMGQINKLLGGARDHEERGDS